MSEPDETRDRIARAIWEVSHPNPPGWAAWGDYTGWGPSGPERKLTLAQAEAVLALLPDLIAAAVAGERVAELQAASGEILKAAISADSLDSVYGQAFRDGLMRAKVILDSRTAELGKGEGT